MGTERGPSPEVKRLGSEADHSPPTSAEVKNTWIYTFTPPYAFMAYCLLNTGTNFIKETVGRCKLEITSLFILL
jgi:hypothetical protein